MVSDADDDGEYLGASVEVWRPVAVVREASMDRLGRNVEETSLRLASGRSGLIVASVLSTCCDLDLL